VLQHPALVVTYRKACVGRPTTPRPVPPAAARRMGQAILMDRNQLDEQVLIALGAYRRHAGDSQRDELLGACAEWVTAFLQGRFRRQRDADLVADVSQEVLAVLCRKPSLSALASAHSPLGWLTRLSWFTAVKSPSANFRQIGICETGESEKNGSPLFGDRNTKSTERELPWKASSRVCPVRSSDV
jgi:hypothetical protein